MTRKPTATATTADPRTRYTLGPDIDLDAEVVTEPDGSRLT
jgi:hypothetical protein